jgi:hypothetical protein
VTGGSGRFIRESVLSFGVLPVSLGFALVHEREHRADARAVAQRASRKCRRRS